MGVLAWGDIRLGRVRKEDETREKGRIKCETTSKSEMSRMDRRRKREGRGGREREREIPNDEPKGEQVQTWPVRKSLTARGQKLPEGLVRVWKRH